VKRLVLNRFRCNIFRATYRCNRKRDRDGKQKSTASARIVSDGVTWSPYRLRRASAASARSSGMHTASGYYYTALCLWIGYARSSSTMLSGAAMYLRP
jgi:hypothetical protein